MEQKDRTAAQRLDALVEKGRQAGALTIGDLLTLEELDLSLEETERFYDRIERLNIDIAFEDPPAQALDAAEDMTDPGCLLRVLSMYESPEVNRFIRFYRQFRHALGRDPSAEEIAAELHMPVGKVRDILKIAQEPVSLETPIGEEEDSHLGDFIPDEDASEPSEAASFSLLKEQLMEVLDTLTPREKKVLELRFGIVDGRTRTLEEVGKEFNVTRERIRQIEAKALRKLRHPSRSKKLRDFLN